MHLTGLPLVSLAALALAVAPALSAERAGETTRVQPQSYQKTGVYPFNLRRGSEIYRDANVYTKEYGSVAMLFDDGTDLTLGPNTDVTIDEYVYAPGGAGRAVISFGKGALRMVSGTMPKEGVTIDTPVATVGIRGTTFSLALPTAAQLLGWVEDGTVMAAPVQGTQSYSFAAPASFVCSASSCEQTGSEPPPSIGFEPAPPGEGAGPGEVNGRGGDHDSGHGGSNF